MDKGDDHDDKTSKLDEGAIAISLSGRNREDRTWRKSSPPKSSASSDTSAEEEEERRRRKKSRERRKERRPKSSPLRRTMGGHAKRSPSIMRNEFRPSSPSWVYVARQMCAGRPTLIFVGSYECELVSSVGIDTSLDSMEHAMRICMDTAEPAPTSFTLRRTHGPKSKGRGKGSAGAIVSPRQSDSSETLHRKIQRAVEICGGFRITLRREDMLTISVFISEKRRQTRPDGERRVFVRCRAPDPLRDRKVRLDHTNVYAGEAAYGLLRGETTPSICPRWDIELEI